MPEAVAPPRVPSPPAHEPAEPHEPQRREPQSSGERARAHLRGPGLRLTRGARLDSIPRVAATFAGVLAIAGLVARWSAALAQGPAPPDLAVRTPRMVVATAAALLLAAGALWLVRPPRRPWAAGVGRAAAGATAAVGLATLGRYATEWVGGVPRPLAPGTGWWAERPSAPTALALVLIGFATATLGARRARVRRWAPRAAAAALVVVLAGVVGHAYGADVLYGRTRWGGMAVSTATALGALALGVLGANPRRGLAALLAADDAGGRLLRRLTPPAVLAPLLLGWLALAAQAHGLVDAAFGAALLVVALVVVLVGAVVREAAALRAFDAERTALYQRAEAARLEAEAASRAKGEFLAVMSHELRTPLNAIGGYAELMELGIRGPVTAEQREDLGRVRRSQRHLLGLVNEVLNFAKLEAGSVRYDLRAVPVHTALLEAEALVAPQAGAKGLTIALDDCPPATDGRPLAGEPLRVRADPEKLRQVLVNLLSNAVKFTDRPGSTIALGCEGGPERGVARLHVRDAGIGIPADKLAAIFEPFVQVRTDRARPAESTGLGLAISRDLARGMGGDLTAESAVGVGSTFTLTLPRA